MLRSYYYRCLGLALLSAILLVACNDPARPGRKAGKGVDAGLICSCKPNHITPDDWRIEYKNGSLPQNAATETTVAEILKWPEGSEPSPRSQRSGRELTLFHVTKAYLQSIFLRRGDCDLHIEVSEQAGKDAPRMIVETPGTSEYCLARTKIFSDLRSRGITLTDLNREIAQPVPVEITGVGFRDQKHTVWFARGSQKVATLWELHPAIVKLLP